MGTGPIKRDIERLQRLARGERVEEEVRPGPDVAAGFRADFRGQVLRVPGVKAVHFFGSAAGTEPTLRGFGESSGRVFRPGKSDLDVVVEGKVSDSDKERIDKLIEDLNYKHSLGLETAGYMHPTPFYVENWLDRTAFREAFDGHLHLVQLFSRLRERVKAKAPTYGDYWAGKDVRADLRRITPAVETMFLMFS